MLKRLKKAFTIVELVIVIAVIAILAAVLIPTFVNVTKQAKLSNDQSQIRQMNTVAAMENATDNFVYAGDAVNALYNNGWNTSKLSTYSGGYHYAFSLKSTTWYLLDESGAAVFPDSDVDKSDLWVLYNNQSMDVVDGVTTYIAVDNVTNDQHYQAGFGSNSSNSYTIDLNGGYIATTNLDNVTVVNGILVSGAKSGDGINTGYDVLSAWSNDKATTATDGTYCFEKVIFNGLTIISADSDYMFTDCVFYNTDLGSSVTNGDRTFINCKFTNTSTFAIQAAKNLTVENCEFTNCARGINVINTTCTERPANRTITIKNNVFGGITANKAIIQLAYGHCSSTHNTHTNREEAEKVQSETKVEISGNTFNGLGACLGIVRIHEAIGKVITETEKTELVNNVTFSNNSVNSSIDKDKYVIGDNDNSYNDLSNFNEYGKALVSALLAKFN